MARRPSSGPCLSICTTAWSPVSYTHLDVYKRQLYVYANQPGSSLDPSGSHVPGRKSLTAKMGLDCTIPWDADRAKYERGEYGRVDLSRYL